MGGRMEQRLRGLPNIQTKQFKGAQISGIANVSKRRMKGIQIAPVVQLRQ